MTEKQALDALRALPRRLDDVRALLEAQSPAAPTDLVDMFATQLQETGRVTVHPGNEAAVLAALRTIGVETFVVSASPAVPTEPPDPQSFVPGFRVRYIELDNACANDWPLRRNCVPRRRRARVPRLRDSRRCVRMTDTPTPRTAGPYIECAKCGDRIRSLHRHDFRCCKCKETFVDGGSSYLRVGGYPVMDGERIKVWRD